MISDIEIAREATDPAAAEGGTLLSLPWILREKRTPFDVCDFLNLGRIIGAAP